MKHLRVVLFFIVVLTCILVSAVCVSANASANTEKSEEELRQFANENDTWVLCYQQGNRTTDFYQYDATSEYMYFSYSKHSCVDVYNLDGVFLYSFILPDRQNGGVSVRCENDLTYISTKDNVLYIFEGIEEVDCMNYEEATANGYDFFWFNNNNPSITVEEKWIRWHGEGEETIREIDTPKVVQQTIPVDEMPVFIMLLLFVLIIFFIEFVRRLSKRAVKKA